MSIRLAFLALAFSVVAGQNPPGAIQVDNPEEASVFPPDFTAPTFEWREPEGFAAREWRITATFSDSGPALVRTSHGEPMQIGEIDPRCVAPSNQPPKLTPQQAAAHTWKPDPQTWEEIRRRSTAQSATVVIEGLNSNGTVVSRGQVHLSTSKDPVGAPIFYRDVPLMPTEVEKGVIKPIIPSAVPFIAWRLKYPGESGSHLLMQGLPTCANCHSFSRDGKTLAMDVDGPQNDKGMYAIAPISQHMAIRTQDVFTWNDFPDKLPGHRTIGFMAQVSPDGQYAVTTVNEDVYVSNFKDYRFLQVFYPTRGILAWYNRANGRIRSLPGADNPSFVQTNGFWSPDGEYLVFARAKARDAYPKDVPLAAYAGDPLETPIQYDLYRIPFNHGKGGRPKPIRGASGNGMSNSFPKVSPDGRWIVFVQSRNGQLMRPDGQLYIVPAEGGEARRMRCNTARMNSWHSFSPNGRWMVFSSKSRSPYTQMFLTHIDENGNDTPPILIENTTAANRAVNIPEFLNIAPGGLEQIDVPAAEFYRLFDSAWNLAEKGRFEESVAEWNRALALDPTSAKAHNNLGRALAGKGDYDAAVAHWQKAIELNPTYWEAHNNMGVALLRKGRPGEAQSHFERILEANPNYPEVHGNLARALVERGKFDRAVEQWNIAVAIKPDYAEAYNDLAGALLQRGRAREAISTWQKAVEVKPSFAPAYFNLGNAFAAHGKDKEALAAWRAGLRYQPDQVAVLNQAAWLLAASSDSAVRDGAQAVALAERAVALTSRQDATSLDTLAAAYAETGRYADAADTARLAWTSAQRQNRAALAEAIQRRAALYQGKSPFHGSRQ